MYNKSVFKINPEQCKEEVAWGNWGRVAQCKRKHVKDGYCKQHHPDSVEERRQKTMERYNTKDREHMISFYGRQAIVILQKIATEQYDGDPVTFAKDWLKERELMK